MEKLFSGLEKILQVASTIDSPLALSALGMIIVALLAAYWLSRRSVEKEGAIRSGDTKMVESLDGRFSLNLDTLTPAQTSSLATKDLFLRFLSGMFSRAVLAVFCIGLLVFLYLLAVDHDRPLPGPPPAHPEQGSIVPPPPQTVPCSAFGGGIRVLELTCDAPGKGGGVWTVAVQKHRNAPSTGYTIFGNVDGQVCSSVSLGATTTKATMTCAAPSAGPGHLILTIKPTDTNELDVSHPPVDVTVIRTN